MSTASSPPSSKANTRAPTEGTGDGASDGAGAIAPDAGGSTVPRARRRAVLWASAAGAALLAAAYGHFALGMRFGPPLVMVALGGMTLAFSASALWRVIDPLTRGDVASIVELRAPHRIRELEREKQAVLKAIKEIELDHQMRKISEVDYREMVERYRTRALRVMGDLAMGDDYRALIERELKHRVAARAAAGTGGDGDAASAGAEDSTAGGPGPSCPACAVANDPNAQFCKKCGHKLGSLAAPA
ncbi:MAG: zinc ribbon domain-containing protein [Verrucomicrobiota bacterium]